MLYQYYGGSILAGESPEGLGLLIGWADCGRYQASRRNARMKHSVHSTMLVTYKHLHVHVHVHALVHVSSPTFAVIIQPCTWVHYSKR